MGCFVHPTAVVEKECQIGEGTRIWHFAHVRSGAHLGEGCVIGKGVFIDTGVRVGRNTKIQNNVSVYHGVEVGDGVFIGPHVCFTNDKFPRAVMPDMSLRSEREWTLARTRVEDGVSIGANATIVANTTLGKWCMIGAGAVVTTDVPPHALVLGNPGKIRGVVAATGEIVSRQYRAGTFWTSDKEHKVEVLPEWVR